MEKSHHPSLDSVLLRYLNSQNQECTKLSSQLHVVSETRNFKMRQHGAQTCHVEFSTLSIFCTLAFKLVMGLMLRIPTQIADGLQLIHIRDGLCSLGIHVCSCFRCRPLPTFPMWKFMHRKQRSASAWDKDFVNVSDRFSLVGTLVTCKSFLYRLL